MARHTSIQPGGPPKRFAPLAGNAYWLFTLGLIGTGYWELQCSQVPGPRRNGASTGFFGLALTGGLAIDFAGLDAVK
ncbi:MAG: hypothetical protein JO307_17360 [Bryobacterales bacterium]|nr:hypothetical protein [Bryobacterales bacterium]